MGKGVTKTVPQIFRDNICTAFNLLNAIIAIVLVMVGAWKNILFIFAILIKYGNSKLAIRYAKRIIKDGSGKTPTEIAPGTKVYELVEELAKYLPEEVQTQFVDK